MFSKEVELADSMQTLFRGNSLASKIMTFCFKVGDANPRSLFTEPHVFHKEVCVFEDLFIVYSRLSSIVLFPLLFDSVSFFFNPCLFVLKSSPGLWRYVPAEASGAPATRCPDVSRAADDQFRGGSHQVASLRPWRFVIRRVMIRFDSDAHVGHCSDQTSAIL